MLEQESWRNFGCENVRFKSDKVCLKALPSTWTLSTFSSDSSSFVSSPCQSLYDSEVRSSFKGFHWQVSPTGTPGHTATQAGWARIMSHICMSLLIYVDISSTDSYAASRPSPESPSNRANWHPQPAQQRKILPSPSGTTTINDATTTPGRPIVVVTPPPTLTRQLAPCRWPRPSRNHHHIHDRKQGSCDNTQQSRWKQ